MLNFICSSKSIKKIRRKSHPPSSQQYEEEEEEEEDDNSSSSSTISLPKQPQQPQQQYYFHHYDKEAWNNKKSIKPTNHSVSSFDASCVPTDLNGEPSVVKNSLDYLSYAIAMTEKNDAWKTSSSPTNLAAETMLMFVNSNESTA